jgi:hypothetical protein
MGRVFQKTAVGVLAIAVALCGLSSRARASQNACETSAEVVARACLTAARSARWVAVAKCLNLSDQTAKKTCRTQVAADLKDAVASCDDQDNARDDACLRLGSAPYDPVIDPANFVATIDNPYFPLIPGTTFIYEGQTEAGFEHVEFAVTHNTKVILGVTCVEVHDTVLTDGQLTEDTLDWFAQDSAGNVWYFGENTHELVDGLITTIAGSFVAGVDGDKPGIIMKATPAVGNFYRQESSLANAEDFADVISLTESVTVPTGSYTNCLKTQETTPLEPELLEHKYYAPGVGNVLTVDANTGDRSELIQIIIGP